MPALLRIRAPGFYAELRAGAPAYFRRRCGALAALRTLACSLEIGAWRRARNVSGRTGLWRFRLQDQVAPIVCADQRELHRVDDSCCDSAKRPKIPLDRSFTQSLPVEAGDSASNACRSGGLLSPHTPMQQNKKRAAAGRPLSNRYRIGC